MGTAGWSIPKAHAEAIAGEGTHLVRYASVMQCLEINSTFYRMHQQVTSERWGAWTPTFFLCVGDGEGGDS